MTVHVASVWMEAMLLLSIRLGVVLFATPLLGSSGVPARIKVLLVVAFAVAMIPITGVPEMLAAQPRSMAVAILCELFWGGVMAFSLQTAFAAFMVAGRILDMQAGFSMATLLDPATRTHVPLLGVALHMFAIVWFLAVDGHHWVVRGLVASLATVPLGSSITSVPVEAVVRQFAFTFAHGLVLVAAVVVCLLLIDVAMGVASRVLPQANVFILSAPIKMMVALGVLSASMFYMQPVIKRLFKTSFDFWHYVTVP